LQSAGVRTALFDLLDREGRVIEDSFRRGVGVSNEYGESYGGYYSALLGKLSEVADYKDKRTLEVFARASYNRDSPFARKLAESGQPIVPVALELLKSDRGTKRDNAVAILGMVYERRQVHRLPEQSVQLIKQTITTTATKDSDSVTRKTAVEILGRIGTASDLPLLQTIAATDPASYKRGQTRRYNVREAAVEAIAAIRKRTGQK
jgi:HEAT repeat protein